MFVQWYCMLICRVICKLSYITTVNMFTVSLIVLAYYESISKGVRMRDVADQALIRKINTFMVRKSLQFPELNLCNKHKTDLHQNEQKLATRTKIFSNRGAIV